MNNSRVSFFISAIAALLEECTGSRLCNHKNGSGNAGAPSNLWVISNNDSSEQEIESRLMEINEFILKSESGKPSGQPGHESS